MDINMSIPEKLNCLEQCINKAENVEYSVQVLWGRDPEEAKREIRTIIANGRSLFVNGKIEALDYDVRQEAYHKWHNILNAHLKKFPEFQKIEEEAVSMGR